MGTKDKLIERFKLQPKDFTYQELSKLLKQLGFEQDNKGKTSGSRVKFFNTELGFPIILHKPHPGNVIKSYALRQVLEELTAMGLLKNE